MRTSLISALGGTLGFLSRPCCSIPFFLSFLGLSGSSFGVVLLPYRNLLLIASLLAFAISAHHTFRVQGAIFNKLFFVVSFLGSLLFIILPNL